LADGETVVDVPAKLAARVRVFDTGHGRKTDATDAHSIAVVALRTRGLRRLVADEDLTVLRLLADRRDELSRSRNRTLNRLHRLLAELVPAGAPRHLSVLQAKALLASVRPRGVAGRTRRALAAELVAELKAVEGKLKALKRRLADAVTAAGSGLMDVYGIGPAARRPDPGRRRRHGPVRRPRPLRLLDRHSADRRLLRRTDPPPARPSRQPPAQPRPLHRRRRASVRQLMPQYGDLDVVRLRRRAQPDLPQQPSGDQEGERAEHARHPAAPA